MWGTCRGHRGSRVVGDNWRVLGGCLGEILGAFVGRMPHKITIVADRGEVMDPLVVRKGAPVHRDPRTKRAAKINLHADASKVASLSRGGGISHSNRLTETCSKGQKDLGLVRVIRQIFELKPDWCGGDLL